MNIILCSGDKIQGQEIIIAESKSIDMEQVKEKYYGRSIAEKAEFSEVGSQRAFSNLYKAEGWLSHRGYSYGSLDGNYNPVAICKGEYTLPQKWHNMTLRQQDSVVGIMISNNWRTSKVTVIIFEQ